MPSSFTWLDYSEVERRRMLDVIELFGERATRDELGLGGVRDAFADLLFPGTSTIQTRAKYFLVVPWVYSALEQKGVPSASAAQQARKLESKVMQAIEQSGDAEGLIGKLARENVRRLPSSVYWQGLHRWGIRTFHGSQDEYHRALDPFYLRRRGRQSRNEDFDGEAALHAEPHNWHTGLPYPPSGFPEHCTFKLTLGEAGYLRDRIVTQCPDSLLAYLVQCKTPIEEVKFAWDMAAAVPADLQLILEHGRWFSEVMLGAQLLYNLMLADKRKWQDLMEHYRSKLDEWWSLLDARRGEFQNWNRVAFWKIVLQGNPRISMPARKFVDDWVSIVRSHASLPTLLESPGPRALVERREIQLKRGGARLTNLRALELWAGAAGADQMDLRWRSAKRISRDILAGLKETEHA